MIPIEKIEIGIRVVTKTMKEGIIIDLRLNDIGNRVYALIELDNNKGTIEFPIDLLSKLN